MELQVMEFRTENIGDILVIKGTADALDAANAMEFKSDITPMPETTKNVALDMRKPRSMDSPGAGATLSCLRTIHNKNRELRLFSVRPGLYKLFQLVRLDLLIDIHENCKTALEAFDRSSDAKA
ncbi:MAG: STAS domain-containing protein [Desulfosalsimonas sp.]